MIWHFYSTMLKPLLRNGNVVNKKSSVRCNFKYLSPYGIAVNDELFSTSLWTQPGLAIKHTKEGTESSTFWHPLGGKQNFTSKKVSPEVVRDPHLFAFSFNKGCNSFLFYFLTSFMFEYVETLNLIIFWRVLIIALVNARAAIRTHREVWGMLRNWKLVKKLLLTILTCLIRRIGWYSTVLKKQRKLQSCWLYCLVISTTV